MTRVLIGKSFGLILAAAVLSVMLARGQTPDPTVPASVRPVFERGLTLHRNGDSVGAIRAFDEAIRLQPTFARAYTLRGTAYMLTGDYQKALSDLNQAIRIDPRNAAAYCDR